jgi:hypothetical protein
MIKISQVPIQANNLMPPAQMTHQVAAQKAARPGNEDFQEIRWKR